MSENPSYGRKETEETLGWLASFPEQDPDPVIEINLDGKVTYLNPVTANRFPDLPEIVAPKFDADSLLEYCDYYEMSSLKDDIMKLKE